MSDAAVTFGIRVLSAALTFALQAVLARVMDLDDYGNYVALWTWLIALGSFAALGFPESAIRFLPRYRARQRDDLARGFWRYGLGLVALGSLALAAAAILVGLVWRLPNGPGLIAIFVGIGLPFFAVELYLEGVARSFGWYRLTTVPVYIVRPLLIAGICVALHLAGVVLDLATVGIVVIGAMAAISLAMSLVIARRLHGIAGAPPRGRQRRIWLRASLPLLVVSGLDDLLTGSDILVLSLLLPHEEVGIYFAAARALALAHFVYFAMYFVAGRGFSLAHAGRDPARLQDAVRQSSRLTFWSTLAALAVTLALGPFLLAVFGESFSVGYPVMAVLAAGLLARAVAGQASEVLIVTGRLRASVWLAAFALAANVALTIALVPALGMLGAAAGTALAYALRSAASILVVRRVTGIRMVSLGMPRLAGAA